MLRGWRKKGLHSTRRRWSAEEGLLNGWLGREGMRGQGQGWRDALLEQRIVPAGHEGEESIDCGSAKVEVAGEGNSRPSDATSASANRPGRNQVTLRMVDSTVLTVEMLSTRSFS